MAFFIIKNSDFAANKFSILAKLGFKIELACYFVV